MNKSLSLDCVYTISTKTQLHSFDRKILSSLYQPIIGHTATALYFSLWSEVEIDKVYSSPSYIKRLTKIMQIDLKSMIDAFDLLEALGLIKTYFKQDEKTMYYQFEIFSPEPPSIFFKNPLLVKNLKNALDNDDFIKTKMFFQMIDKPIDEYEDISKKYRDVFSLNHDPKIINNAETYKNYNYAKVEGEIDFDILKEALKPFQMSHLILEKRIRDTLEMLMLSYDITSHELISSIIDTADDNSINPNELIKNVELKVKIREYKTKLDLIYYKDDNATNKYEKNSVFEFLKKYYKSLKIDNDLLVKLENSMREYNLTTGVFNMLIELVVTRTGIININYLKAIAKQWQTERIDTLEKAKNKVIAINTNTPKKTNYNKTIIGNANEWYQEEDLKTKELTQEELERMDEILNNL